jgi:hypothetical protein
MSSIGNLLSYELSSARGFLGVSSVSNGSEARGVAASVELLSRILNCELGQDVLQMVLRGALGEVETDGDLPVGPTPCRLTLATTGW